MVRSEVNRYAGDCGPARRPNRGLSDLFLDRSAGVRPDRAGDAEGLFAFTSAYIYGPVCVADKERGHGLAAALFADLLARVPDRECFTFIRGDNTGSLRAHAKMGMRTVATFTLGDVDYIVVAYGA
jgi:GNAT superfamily N-acetyltransferase